MSAARRSWGRSAPMVALALALCAALAGCGGAQTRRDTSEATSTPDVSPSAVARGAEEATRSNRPCAAGKLTVGDLVAADAEFAGALAEATKRAQAWQTDARLTELRVACVVLEPRFRWQVIFYSESAQQFFASDTGQTKAAEIDPAKIRDLPTDGLSFARLRKSLAKTGYPDTTELSAVEGVDVRLSTPELPFGPPEAPRGRVYFHLAIDDHGEMKDLFVGNGDGAVYRYRQ